MSFPFVAVFPPSVLFAVDARAYALCALFITIGVLYEKVDAIAFVLAAYSHFYGVLFFPLLVRVGAGSQPALGAAESRTLHSG